MVNNQKTAMSTLMLGAIGVVFGDIGTSPLYALKECLKPFSEGGTVSADNIYGICSLIFWAIFMVVSLKYVFFVMKADNQGEGGILSLMTLSNLVAPPKVKGVLLVLGLVGAATFYGDSVITPAVSVLSAIEGMEIVQPDFAKYVLPIAFTVLLLLFWIQKRGTDTIGKFFGPIMIIWFGGIAALGVFHIIQHPEILKALNPMYAINFVTQKPSLAIIIAGSVFLALTGGEALYADMGHFGRNPINYAWFLLVFPSLALNYFGQGALILGNPKALDNPFYNMAPSWMMIPLVVLATIATVIASQAVISGTYSMTKQAIQLGYIPRLAIDYTSEKEMGQIYIPFINWLLFIAVTALLFAFKTSDALSAAYGIAVVTTMIVTTILMGFVITYKWKWNPVKIVLFLVAFLSIDLLFFVSNILKIEEGGWVPLVFAAIIFFIMTTWKTGRKLVFGSIKNSNMDLTEFIPMIKKNAHINTTEGTAVFLNSIEGKSPVSFMHNLKHNKVIHTRNIFVTFKTVDYPFVKDEERFEVSKIVDGFYQIIVSLGFKEIPNLPEMLKNVTKHSDLDGWKYEEMETSFFLSRETITHKSGGMWVPRESIFAWMSKNSTKDADYFNIPSGRVVELGTQISI